MSNHITAHAKAAAKAAAYYFDTDEIDCLKTAVHHMDMAIGFCDGSAYHADLITDTFCGAFGERVDSVVDNTERINVTTGGVELVVRLFAASCRIDVWVDGEQRYDVDADGCRLVD